MTEIDISLLILANISLQNGKDCLGDIIYRYVTAEQFAPECLLDCLDLSSEHHTLDVANRIEAAVHVWRLKDRKEQPNPSKSKKKSWGGKVMGLVADGGKNQFLSQRAETLLHSLRLRFPGLPQTALDMSKIQYNKVYMLCSFLLSSCFCCLFNLYTVFSGSAVQLRKRMLHNM